VAPALTQGKPIPRRRYRSFGYGRSRARAACSLRSRLRRFSRLSPRSVEGAVLRGAVASTTVRRHRRPGASNLRALLWHEVHPRPRDFTSSVRRAVRPNLSEAFGSFRFVEGVSEGVFPALGRSLRATLSCGVTWSSSQVALGVAGLALLLALGCWLFTWMAIWRERTRRSRRVKEAVYEWAGGAATKAELEEIRKTVMQLPIHSSAEVAELQRAVSELAERLTSLEAERQSRAESRRFS
jgi:hypothetical protein